MEITFRTLISTLLVIQMNSKVQTQGDRLVRVGCILNNSTNSSNGMPDDLAIGSSIQFNSLRFLLVFFFC